VRQRSEQLFSNIRRDKEKIHVRQRSESFLVVSGEKKKKDM